jgi:hypothetical protein
MPYVKASEAARYLNVSISTIKRYARNSDIKTEKLPTRRYKYWINDSSEDNRNTYLYARVSSRKQHNDLSDKSHSSEEMFQRHPFSLILGLVSITTEKTLKPFFNNLSKVKSKKLWLPIKTDSLELDSPSFSGSFSSLDQNLFLWTQNNFLKQPEMKCLMTSWKLSLSSQ